MAVSVLERVWSCRHQFSWPRHTGNGECYQICLQCGVKYRYDWSAMRRTGPWEHEGQEIPETKPPRPARRISGPLPRRTRTETAKGHTWRPRERRLHFETSVLYRQKEKEAVEWLHGHSENISRSGLLFQVAEELPKGTALELILEMPAEITGTAGAKVICQATVSRIARHGTERPRLAVKIDDYQFLPHGQVAGL